MAISARNRSLWDQPLPGSYLRMAIKSGVQGYQDKGSYFAIRQGGMRGLSNK